MKKLLLITTIIFYSIHANAAAVAIAVVGGSSGANASRNANLSSGRSNQEKYFADTIIRCEEPRSIGGSIQGCTERQAFSSATYYSFEEYVESKCHLGKLVGMNYNDYSDRVILFAKCRPNQ